MSSEFITGDSKTKLVQLKINNATFVIAPTSVVTAQLVTKDKMKVLTAEPVVCTDDMLGADWETALLAVKFPRSSTAGIKTFGAALLEIQVTTDPLGDLEDWTFYIPVTITKGNLA